MTIRLRVATCLIALAMLVTAADTGFAQVVFRNPPCPAITINNNTLCTAQLNFVPVPPGWPNPVLVPATGSIVLPGPPVGGMFTINGIRSMGGIFYPFLAPPFPVIVNCGAGDWWISNVTLGPPPGCCFDICANPATCTINLNPSGAPPPCRP